MSQGVTMAEARHAALARGGRDRQVILRASRHGPRPVLERSAGAVPHLHRRSGLELFWAIALGVTAGCATFAPLHALRLGTVLGVIILAVHVSSRIRPSAATILLGLFTAEVCLSWFWAEDPHAAAVAATSHVGVVTIFLAVRTVVTDRTRFLVVAGGYLLGCLWTVRQISVTNPAAVFGLRFTGTRFAIPGLNANYAAYAFVGGILILGALYWTPNARSLFFRVLSVALALPMAWGIVQSGTRGAAIACACLAAWLFACRVLPVRPAFTALVIVVAVAGLGTLTGAIDPLLRYFDGFWSRNTGDLAGRLTIWPRARDQILENPPWGLGTGNFAATDRMGLATHNLLLEITVGLGVIGLVLLSAFLWAAFRVTRADPPSRLIIVGCFVSASWPIYLSGVWDLSPAGWVILALFTRGHVLAGSDDAPTSASHRVRSASTPRTSRFAVRAREPRISAAHQMSRQNRRPATRALSGQGHAGT